MKIQADCHINYMPEHGIKELKQKKKGKGKIRSRKVGKAGQ